MSASLNNNRLINQCELSAPRLDSGPCSSLGGPSDWPLSSGTAVPSDASFKELWRGREARPFGASLLLQEVPAGSPAGLLTRLYWGSRDLGWIM